MSRLKFAHDDKSTSGPSHHFAASQDLVAIGTKRTCAAALQMSAIGGKADIGKPFQKGRLNGYDRLGRPDTRRAENISARSDVLATRPLRAHVQTARLKQSSFFAIGSAPHE
jgi:hypothetical protein